MLLGVLAPLGRENVGHDKAPVEDNVNRQGLEGGVERTWLGVVQGV